MPFHKILCPPSVTSLPRTAASTTVHEIRAAGAGHVASRMFVGAPANEVLEMLDEDPSIDLVVLGVEGLHRKGGMQLDGGVRRILRNAPCPVLLSPAALPSSFKAVLCEIDGAGGQGASTELASNMVDENGSITLFRVHELTLLEAASPRKHDDDDDGDELEELDSVAASLQGRCAHVAAVLRTGRPSVEILDVLREGCFDLVILREYRRSLASKIVRQVKCPVLFARGRTARTDDRALG